MKYDSNYYFKVLRKEINETWSELSEKERLTLYYYMISDSKYEYRIMKIVAGMKQYTNMGLPETTLNNLREESEREVYKMVAMIDESIIEMIRKMCSNTDIEKLKSYIEPSKVKKEEYTRSDVCAKCGGSCCKSRSCYFSPKNFKAKMLSTEANVRKILDTGLVVIDRHDADSNINRNIYLLRPKMICDGDRQVNYPFTSPCFLLGEHGCELEFRLRPYAGAMVIPNDSETKCHYENEEMNKDANLYMTKLWDQPHYQRILEKIAMEKEDTSTPIGNSFMDEFMSSMVKIYDEIK